MLICQRNSDLQPDLTFQQEFDWLQPAKAYPNLEEMPSFISRHQVSAPSVPSQPPLTLRTSKGSSFKLTPLYVSILGLTPHPHSG